MNPDDIRNLLKDHGHNRLVSCLELLDPDQRDTLLREVAALDFREIQSLYQGYQGP